MMMTSRKSWTQLASSERMNGTPPPSTVALTGSFSGIASSSAAIRMNDATPPQIRACRMARGTCRPASFVSSEMSPADSNP